MSSDFPDAPRKYHQRSSANVTESTVAINTRHRDCLRHALEACDRGRETMKSGLAAEYIAVDLNDALHAVGEVIGAVDVEQILDSVFSQFCIGK